MITNGFTYLAFLIFFASIVIFIEKKSNSKFFNFVPAIVIIYFGAMLMSTFHVWELNDGVLAARGAVKNNLLPAMIFLMLLRCDLRDIAKLGPKMILTFIAATTSIILGFTISFALFKSQLAANTWQTFGALAGSWIGGTQNMVAVQQVLGLEGSGMGYSLLIDSIDYSMWIMFLLALVPFASKFNKWTNADTTVVEEIGKRLTEKNSKIRKEIEFVDLMTLLGVTLAVAAASQELAAILPKTSFLNGTTWTVILATAAGIVCAMGPLGKIPGSPHLSNIFLYTIVGLIASTANFAELTQAPMYIIAGFVILGVHGLILVTIAKIFKLDLFTCGIASLANIGGVASAPVLAASYSEALVPIGVLMGMLGAIIGTGGGLFVAKILSTMI